MLFLFIAILSTLLCKSLVIKYLYIYNVNVKINSPTFQLCASRLALREHKTGKGRIPSHHRHIRSPSPHNRRHSSKSKPLDPITNSHLIPKYIINIDFSRKYTQHSAVKRLQIFCKTRIYIELCRDCRISSQNPFPVYCSQLMYYSVCNASV